MRPQTIVEVLMIDLAVLDNCSGLVMAQISAWESRRYGVLPTPQVPPHPWVEQVVRKMSLDRMPKSALRGPLDLHEPCDGLAGLGDNHFFAPFNHVEEFRKAGLCLLDVVLCHVDQAYLVNP